MSILNFKLIKEDNNENLDDNNSQEGNYSITNKTNSPVRIVITDKNKDIVLLDEIKSKATRNLECFADELLRANNFGLITVYWFDERKLKYDEESKACIRFGKHFRHVVDINSLTNCLNISNEDENY